METDMPSGVEATSTRRLKWGWVIISGLLTGILLFVLGRGNPWGPSDLFTTTIMGRTIQTAVAAPGFELEPALMHLGLSVIYAAIIAPLVYRIHGILGVFFGGVAGLGLYFANYLIARVLMGMPAFGSEAVPLLYHIAFGAIMAGLYKGLARERVLREAVNEGELPSQ